MDDQRPGVKRIKLAAKFSHHRVTARLARLDFNTLLHLADTLGDFLQVAGDELVVGVLVEMQREVGTTCRVCCVGAAGVGKSALTTMLSIRRFSEAYDPTVEEELRQECVLASALSTDARFWPRS